ncbi:MAG: hypothetical protein M1833_000183 [Piccolia ochrophora]|nr:MAG: hypothetical protein M1833_000183 [Piccolia ochrophora]
MDQALMPRGTWALNNQFFSRLIICTDYDNYHLDNRIVQEFLPNLQRRYGSTSSTGRYDGGGLRVDLRRREAFRDPIKQQCLTHLCKYLQEVERVGPQTSHLHDWLEGELHHLKHSDRGRYSVGRSPKLTRYYTALASILSSRTLGHNKILRDELSRLFTRNCSTLYRLLRITEFAKFLSALGRLGNISSELKSAQAVCSTNDLHGILSHLKYEDRLTNRAQRDVTEFSHGQYLPTAHQHRNRLTAPSPHWQDNRMINRMPARAHGLRCPNHFPRGLAQAVDCQCPLGAHAMPDFHNRGPRRRSFHDDLLPMSHELDRFNPHQHRRPGLPHRHTMPPRFNGSPTDDFDMDDDSEDYYGRERYTGRDFGDDDDGDDNDTFMDDDYDSEYMPSSQRFPYDDADAFDHRPRDARLAFPRSRSIDDFSMVESSDARSMFGAPLGRTAPFVHR